MPVLTSNLFQYAQLADASYAILGDEVTNVSITNPDDVSAALQSTRSFSLTQATDFVANWSVLNHQVDTDWDIAGSGFSATLFRSTKEPFEVVLAIRGTAGLNDTLDADINGLVTNGLAYNQIIDLYNYVQRLKGAVGADVQQTRLVLADLDTPFSETLLVGGGIYALRYKIEHYTASGVGLGFANEVNNLSTVVGHSLGGHLAFAFTRLFAGDGLHAVNAVTVNGAGFPTGIFPGVGGWASHNIEMLFTSLQGSTTFDSNHIFNMYADANPEIVTQDWLIGLQQQGTHSAVYIEDPSILGGAIGHGATGVTDSMAVYDIFFRLDPSLSGMDGSVALAALKPIFDAGSNDDRWDDLIPFKQPNRALENIVGVLSEIFGLPAYIPTDDRESLYLHIHDLINSSRFMLLEGTFDVISLVGMSSSDMVSAARNDIGVLYALVNLNHFALTGNTAFYDGLNANGTYNLDKYSSEFLADRAEMLRFRILYDTGATDSNQLFTLRDRFYDTEWDTNSPGNFDYVSLGNNGENFRLVVDGSGTGNTQVIMFDDGSGNELISGAGDDRLYGLWGDNRLVGGAGNDRMEGGQGVDQYVAGDGRDIIRDSDGRGRIVWSGADGFVVAGRDGVSDVGNNWIKINDTTYFDRQNAVTYYTVQNFDGTSTLVISSPSRTNGTGSIRVENFHDGDLGITLGAAPAEPVAATITDGPDVYGQSNGTYFVRHTVNGLGGNDLISGGMMNDYLVGGAGDDVLIGDAGNDTLMGGSGNDYFFENEFYAASSLQSPLGPEEEVLAANAVVRGESWFVTNVDGRVSLNYDSFGGGSLDLNGNYNDIVIAGIGDDHAWLGVGNDYADGGEGNDYLQGGHDHDVISGGAGDDLIIGDGNGRTYERFTIAGNDILSGDAGNDAIVGNGGNDTIAGGDGDDLISGDNSQVANAGVTLTEQVTGEDYIDAGAGNDVVHGGGGKDVIYGGTGNDSLYGDNAYTYIGLDKYREFDGDDEIRAGDGDDFVAGMGGNDVIYGDAGNDILHGDNTEIGIQYHGNDQIFGGEGNDGIRGNAGNDQLDGGAGDDTLQGDEGDDVLTGGLGNDFMRGDAGNDTYLIGSTWGIDTVSGLGEGNSGQDVIRFGAGIDPTTLGVQFSDAGVTLFRDAQNILQLEGFMNSSHRIEFANGTVWTAQSMRERLLAQLQQQSGNVVDNLGFGSSLDDQMLGATGADVLFGYGGDDTLTGQSGNDILYGGLGNDAIAGGQGNDAIYGGAGNDTANGGDGTSAASGNDVIYGEAGEDTLNGADGQDQLWGGDGNDVLNGGLGNDTLDGGAGNDIYEFAAGFGNDTVVRLNAAEGLNDSIRFAEDIVASSLIYMRGENDSLLIHVLGSMDNVVLEGFFALGANHTISFADGSVLQQNQIVDLLQTPLSDSGPITIQGSTDIDLLVGGSGNNTIYGDLGNDTIMGYAGDDVIYGGPEQITASWTPDNDSVFGGDGNDELYGQQGNDRLNGGNGNDLLIGGAGEDYLIGGNGNDSLRDGFFLINNVLIDELSNDVLEGGNGNDSLRGGLGTNVYRFGAGFGQDTINLANAPQGLAGISHENAILEFSVGIAASDISISRTAEDLVITNGQNTITIVGFRTSLANLSFQFMDGSRLSPQQLLGLSSLTGSNVNDLLQGTYRNDVLSGLGGDDVLEGGYGNDLLDGGAGNDTLNGGFGADTLMGGTGDDVLNAGEIGLRNWVGLLKPYDEGSNDLLEGGAGNDQLTGGLGVNTYRFASGFGQDTINLTQVGSYGQVGLQDEIAILSFASGISAQSLSFSQIGADLVITSDLDQIIVKNYYAFNGVYGGTRLVFEFGDGTNLSATQIQIMNTFTGTADSDAMQGTSRNDFFLGMAGDDHIYGYAGDDSIQGGLGNDELNGGEGNDAYIFSVGDGSDRILDNSGVNILRLGVGILPENILVVSSAGEWLYDIEYGLNRNEQTNAALYLRISGTTDSIQLATYGSDGRLALAISRLEFANGVVWDQAELNRRLNEVILVGTMNNDIITGSNRDEVIYGLSGDDLIAAGSGNDVIIGGYNNDTLDGGLGADSMSGGADDDIYIVDNSGDLVIENAGEGTDTVQSSVTYTLVSNVETLTLTGNSAINATGNSLNNVLIGNSANNTLNGGSGNDTMSGGVGNDIYVVNATGDIVAESANEGTDLVQSGVTYTLGNNVENLTLTGSALINGTGNSLDNVLIGNSANNTLTGGAGNDTLDGGTGNDTMIGGTGNDTFVVNVATDVVTENASEGTDLVRSAVTYTIGSNVENLSLTGSGVINATGNTLDNILTGNSANNTLTGGAGNDTLDGGAGTDTMLGGAGNDTFVVNVTTDVVTEAANEGTDTVQSSVTYTLGTNVENLTLIGTSTINATGNTLNNVLTGNSANNTLSGGTGNDTMIGAAGNDIYVVDATGDVITELSNEGTDLVQSSVTYTLATNIENLTLTGTATTATGNTLDNVLTGNASNNTLNGGDGNDTLNGGSGTDTLVGGLGNDIYIVDTTTDVITESAASGTDTVQSSVNFSLAAAAFNNVENLSLTGTATTATGNALDNVLTGNASNNTLTGGAGNDTLDGGAGNDTMVGGAGNDIFVVNVSGDIVTEAVNEGTDTVQSAITYTLGNNVENLSLTGTAVINGTGNALNNVMSGNSANNTLNGGAGNDTLNGGQGSDTLIGGGGVNQLYGNEGNDILSSDAAATGGSGYEGGTGNDTITGGQQNDTYRFNIGDGQDTITDAGLAGFTDVISFGAGITSSMLSYARVGDNLLISVNGSADTITVNSWYSNTLNQIEQISFANGTSLNASQIQTLTSGLTLRAASTTSTQDLSNMVALSTPLMEDNFMTRLLNEHRFSNQSLLDQIQTLNDLVRPGHYGNSGWLDGTMLAPIEANHMGDGELALGSITATASESNMGNGGSAHGSEAALPSAGLSRRGAARLDARIEMLRERQASRGFGEDRRRFHEQELGLLIESMSQFGHRNTAVDTVKPINNDQLQPIVIVPPSI